MLKCIFVVYINFKHDQRRRNMQNPFKKLWLKQQVQEIDSLDNQEINNPNQELCDHMIDFYRQHQDMFKTYFEQDDKSQLSKKDFIKSIYNELDYTGPSMSEKPGPQDNITLHRGIRAESAEEIQQFAEGFSNGEVVYGKKASLHGTGIYMSTDESVAQKYATYDKGYGAVIKCSLPGEVRMIDDGDLAQLKNDVLATMRQSSDPGVQQYAGFLDLDNGAFAAVAGYDAINIPDKGYVLALNREKLFVDGIDYYIDQELQRNGLSLTHETAEINAYEQSFYNSMPTQEAEVGSNGAISGNEEIDLDELCQGDDSLQSQNKDQDQEIDINELCKDDNTHDTIGKAQQDEEINLDELCSYDGFELDVQNMDVTSQTSVDQSMDISMCDMGIELTLR